MNEDNLKNEDNIKYESNLKNEHEPNFSHPIFTSSICSTQGCKKHGIMVPVLLRNVSKLQTWKLK